MVSGAGGCAGAEGGTVSFDHLSAGRLSAAHDRPAIWPPGSKGRGMARFARAAHRRWLLLFSVIAVLSLAAQPARAAGPAGSPSIETTPLDIVILVDESGSESNTDVRHEIEAAGTIAQTPLNVRSRVTVVGFG